MKCDLRVEIYIVSAFIRLFTDTYKVNIYDYPQDLLVLIKIKHNEWKTKRDPRKDFVIQTRKRLIEKAKHLSKVRDKMPKPKLFT